MAKVRIYRRRERVIIEGVDSFDPDDLSKHIDVTNEILTINSEGRFKPVFTDDWRIVAKKNGSGFSTVTELSSYLDALFQIIETQHIKFNSLPNLP